MDKEIKMPEVNSNITFENAFIGYFNKHVFEIVKEFCFEERIFGDITYISGEIGLGKTYILNALYNEIINHSFYKPCYISCNHLIREYHFAVRNNVINNFRKYFDAYNVLLIDDVQNILTKEKTQEFLTELLDSFLNEGKRIVVTSQIPSIIIRKKLNSKLSSLLSSSLNCRINLFNEKDKLSYIHKLLKKYPINHEEEILTALQKSSNCNLRDYSGIIRTLFAHTKHYKGVVDVSLLCDLGIVDSPVDA